MERIGKEAEDRGLFEDAIHIYELSLNYEKILALLIKLLSPVAALQPSPHSSRDALISKALEIGNQLKMEKEKGKKDLGYLDHLTNPFFCILDLTAFFDEFHAGNGLIALKVLEGLHIIPLTPGELESRLHDFHSLPEEIRFLISEIFLATLKILHSLFGQAKAVATVENVASRELEVKDLKAKARTVGKFAGMIPYRLPGDTNARITQIIALMN